MRVAQGLYEDGLITYMRTDGVDMAPEAMSAARRAIASRYDAGYVPDPPRQYQSKIKNAQEAHEAIRPTDFDRAGGVRRPRAALRAGLQPRAGQPDGVGAARTDDGRADRRRGQGGAPRHRPGRAVPRLPGALRRRPRRCARTRKARACPLCARAMLRPRPGSRRPSISPSRRRAIRRRAWSSGWRNSGSGGRRPTPRSCRR